MRFSGHFLKAILGRYCGLPQPAERHHLLWVSWLQSIVTEEHDCNSLIFRCSAVVLPDVKTILDSYSLCREGICFFYLFFYSWFLHDFVSHSRLNENPSFFFFFCDHICSAFIFLLWFWNKPGSSKYYSSTNQTLCSLQGNW